MNERRAAGRKIYFDVWPARGRRFPLWAKDRHTFSFPHRIDRLGPRSIGSPTTDAAIIITLAVFILLSLPLSPPPPLASPDRQAAEIPPILPPTPPRARVRLLAITK